MPSGGFLTHCGHTSSQADAQGAADPAQEDPLPEGVFNQGALRLRDAMIFSGRPKLLAARFAVMMLFAMTGIGYLPHMVHTPVSPFLPPWYPRRVRQTEGWRAGLMDAVTFERAPIFARSPVSESAYRSAGVGRGACS